MSLWEVILGRTPELILYEDNQATLRIVNTGKPQELRHVSRTHGISISALYGGKEQGIFVPCDCHKGSICIHLHEALHACGYLESCTVINRNNISTGSQETRECLFERGGPETGL